MMPATTRGGNHSVFVNRNAGNASAVPRHTEINDQLAKKICKDLGVPWTRE
jgi:mRNA interferase HicA